MTSDAMARDMIARAGRCLREARIARGALCFEKPDDGSGDSETDLVLTAPAGRAWALLRA
jgi:hypothetical protein